MSFFDKLKQQAAMLLSKARAGLRKFMTGRYGADQLSLHLLLAGIFLYLVSLLTGSLVLSFVSTGLYVYTAFRMLSRNGTKRALENSKYLNLYSGTRQKVRQAGLRFKYRKEYKYFRCPKCRALLRLKRGSGAMHVTCGKCKHQFDQKA